MSPLILTTAPDSPYDVEIANVGNLAGNARGGIPVERAAQRLREFQDEDGKPLTGKKLEDAAKKFADDRGLKTKSFKTIDEDVEERLRVEAGAVPRVDDAREVSRKYGERVRAQVEGRESTLVPEDLPPQETSELPPIDPDQEA